MSTDAERLGELLIEEGVVTEDDLIRGLSDAGLKGSSLEKTLRSSTPVRRADLARMIGSSTRIPVIADLREIRFAGDPDSLIPEDLARKHELVPLARVGDVLCVAKSNYFNRAAIQDVRRATGLKVKVLQADPAQVRAAIEQVYRDSRAALPAPAGAVAPPATVPAPAPAREEILEDLPLISGPESDGEAPVVSAAPEEEIVEIVDAVRIPPHEFASAMRNPLVKLVVEFDEVFQGGRATRAILMS